MPDPDISTISAQDNFLDRLTKYILEDVQKKNLILSDVLILLPTRRACRELQTSFLEYNDGRPTLLPKMSTIGDIDEEEFSISLAANDEHHPILSLPPAISIQKRTILLAQMILKLEGFHHSTESALHLAEELGRFLDEIYIQGADINNLNQLIPEDFAQHWQITIDFLKILKTYWPDILKDNGEIDYTDRRNQLIRALAQYWERTKEKKRIIAAGSTGSLPATAELLSVISHLPNGSVILPGLDLNMDQESWDLIDHSHPQYSLKNFLKICECSRAQISNLSDEDSTRTILCREIMRPAATTQRWGSLSEHKAIETSAFDHLDLLECETEYEEAFAIACAFRETLEHPDKSALLVTPNRSLAKQVSEICKRWNIDIDDSAGNSLMDSAKGAFFYDLIEFSSLPFSVVRLLNLLKNPLLCPDDYDERSELLEKFEYFILRNPNQTYPIQSFNDFLNHIDPNDPLLGPMNLFHANIDPLLNVSKSESLSLGAILEVHLQVLETLTEPVTFWKGYDAQALSEFLSEMSKLERFLGDIHIEDYSQLLQHFMRKKTVRTHLKTNQKLTILGHLEARLMHSDLIILGSLNEGSWPKDASHDSFLSRPMREKFGLQPLDALTGLSAHDFCSYFCKSHILITRAKTSKNMQSKASRWIQRLKTVMTASEYDHALVQNLTYPFYIRKLHQVLAIEPCQKPVPKPPHHAHPKKLSVTKIETLMKNPYAIYAGEILKLKKHTDLEQDLDPKAYGLIIHDFLHTLIKEEKLESKNASDYIEKWFAKNKDKANLLNDKTYTKHRLLGSIEKFLDHEIRWQTSHKPYALEHDGVINLEVDGQKFTLTARVDRIDIGDEGLAIIDYKTGGSFSQKDIRTGLTPQLPLQALILSKGGFGDIDPTKGNYLGYWILGSNIKGLDTVSIHLSEEKNEWLDHIEKNLKILLSLFIHKQTPYYSVPHNQFAPRFNDYDHLARIDEYNATKVNIS